MIANYNNNNNNNELRLARARAKKRQKAEVRASTKWLVLAQLRAPISCGLANGQPSRLWPVGRLDFGRRCGRAVGHFVCPFLLARAGLGAPSAH